MIAADDSAPTAAPPVGPGVYSYTAEERAEEAETPVDKEHRGTPSARPAMSQAEANLMMIEEALIAIKATKKQVAPGVIEDLEVLAVAARKVVKGGGQ